MNAAIMAVLVAALALPAGTGGARGLPARPLLTSGAGGAQLVGQPLVAPGAKADSLVVYRTGFQDANGAPSREGWTGIARQQELSRWHVDTFHCQDLDPSTIPNHAWWCGAAIFDGCQDGYGYGNGWNEWLDWYGHVPDPLLATTVELTARLNHDLEPGYDYLYLQVDGAAGLRDLTSWNGQADGVDVHQVFSVPATDYVPDPNGGTGAVHLRWAGVSDGGWSDEDCLWPTSGMAQLDLIRVTFDQGGGPIQIGPVEDCEGPTVWTPASPPGFGDFSKVWPLLGDLDPCGQNPTPQFAFIDDGIVVPGTDGSHCITWCYGPGGYVINTTGGVSGDPYLQLYNDIWSPPISLPAGYEGCRLEFDIYEHAELDGLSPWIVYLWSVRSIDDTAADPAWSEWDDHDYVYYGGPAYRRLSLDVSGLLLPGRTRMQVCLAVYQMDWWWGPSDHDATPAPYFDNVKVTVFTQEGPSLTTSEAYLAQDAFPASGQLDIGDPGANSVRFDMACNIAPPEEMRNLPGDSICVDARAVRPGSALAGPPEMVYKLRPNHLFDPYRSSGAPNQGVVPGDPTYTGAGMRVEDRFDFDLPDEDFFFPGDVIHYFFKATDTLGGATTLPGDTTGFARFPGDAGYELLRYPSSFVVRALPAVRSATPGDQPRKLFWNDFGGGGAEQEWMHALYECGYVEGDNLDVYYTNAPASGLGNGLGGRATAAQLAGYDAILYSSGDLTHFTITGVDYGQDPGDDVGVLDAWLRRGDKGLLLTGDGLVSDLNSGGGTAGPVMLAFENRWLEVSLAGWQLRDLIGGRSSPAVQPLPVTGNPVFAPGRRWIAGGGCPALNAFDAVIPEGEAAAIAEFLGPDCAAGAYFYAAAVQRIDPTFEANVVYLPCDLAYVIEDTDCGGNLAPSPYAARTLLLRDVLAAFGNPLGSPLVGLPGAPAFSVAAAPNPFNPELTVRGILPAPGRLTVQVYDVRGRLMGTLHDGPAEAGPFRCDWDGRDGAGAAPSGVYFVRVRGPGGERTLKAALIR